MNTTSFFTRTFSVFALAFLVLFTGCDALNSTESEFAAMTEEDAEVASAIIADAMSDQTEGVMADINDMNADIGTSDLEYKGRRFWTNPTLRPCRGRQRSYERTYDPATGVHTLSFTREHEGRGCSKSVSAELNYTFTDIDGEYIAAPKARRDDVNSIVFTGQRSGQGTYAKKKRRHPLRPVCTTGQLGARRHPHRRCYTHR